MKTLKFISIFATLLIFTGCASKVTSTASEETQTTPQSSPVSVEKVAIKTIYLKISHHSDVTADGAYTNAEKELNDAIIKKIKLKIPKANVITTQKPASGLQANVVINEFNYIGGTDLAFAGALPEKKAKLGAKLTLTDITTNKKVRETELGTSAKFSEGIFGGTSSAQIEALAEKIVAAIKAR